MSDTHTERERQIKKRSAGEIKTKNLNNRREKGGES